MGVIEKMNRQLTGSKRVTGRVVSSSTNHPKDLQKYLQRCGVELEVQKIKHFAVWTAIHLANWATTSALAGTLVARPA